MEKTKPNCSIFECYLSLRDKNIWLNLPSLTIYVKLGEPVRCEEERYRDIVYMSKLIEYYVLGDRDLIENVKVIPWINNVDKILISSRWVEPEITRVYLTKDGNILFSHDSGCLFKILVIPNMKLRLDLMEVYEALKMLERHGIDIGLNGNYLTITVEKSDFRCDIWLKDGKVVELEYSKEVEMMEQ